jgi:DNA-binding CsgD family transcriptional regulator
VVVSRDASAGAPAPSGAELVALSECFYRWIFIGALGFVGVSTLAALAFLPLRDSAKSGRPAPSAVVAALVVLLLTTFALLRARSVYLALRRRPQLELVLVAIAAVLLSVVSPLRNELWWSACAILMVLATLAPLRRALGYCLVVLMANLTAHVAFADLAETSTVGILGLWVGLPFWTAMAAEIPDCMAAHILRLNAGGPDEPRPPLQVSVWPTHAAADAPPADDVPRHDPDGAIGSHERMPLPTTIVSPTGTSRLTARQLQVVALLADGLRYGEIASCLAISPGQVYRHVKNAVARLGVQTPAELVTVAVSEGMVPPGSPYAAAGSS